MSLDVSGHQSSHVVGGRPRRRSSLDNSELDDAAAAAAAATTVPKKSNPAVSPIPRPRPHYSRAKSAAALTNFRTNAMRNPKIAGSARFLQKKQSQNCLDLDFHESTHSRKSLAKAAIRAESANAKEEDGSTAASDTVGGVVTVEKTDGDKEQQGGEGNNPPPEEFNTSHDYCSVSEYSDSLVGSCDSFCEADEKSEADQNYMIKDLGASFISDNLGFDAKDLEDEANMDLVATDDEDGPIPGFDDTNDLMIDEHDDERLAEMKLGAVIVVPNTSEEGEGEEEDHTMDIATVKESEEQG